MAEAKRRFSNEKTALEFQSADLRYFFLLPFSERRLVLMALDLLAVNGALLVALALRPGYGLEGTLVLRRPLWFLLLSLLWLLIAHTFDAKERFIPPEADGLVINVGTVGPPRSMTRRGASHLG
jgi:hypothetical protein